MERRRGGDQGRGEEKGKKRRREEGKGEEMRKEEGRGGGWSRKSAMSNKKRAGETERDPTEFTQNGRKKRKNDQAVSNSIRDPSVSVTFSRSEQKDRQTSVVRDLSEPTGERSRPSIMFCTMP